MKRVIYLPSEPYTFNATEYVSTSGGVYETLFQKHGIQFLPIRPVSHVFGQLNYGRSFDVQIRTFWSCTQVTTLVAAILAGHTTPEDVVFTESYFCPGIEAAALAVAHTKEAVAFCIRFVPETMGMIWDSSVAQSMSRVYMPAPQLRVPKEPWIAVSSRLTQDTDPEFLIQVIRSVVTRNKNAVFVICSGLSNLQAEHPGTVTALSALVKEFPSNLRVELESTKSEYFETLRNSKVYFCCSPLGPGYGLLEASLYGCAPVVPSALAYLQALNYRLDCCYHPSAFSEAADCVLAALDNAPQDWSWIHKKYELTSPGILTRMGFQLEKDPPSIKFLSEMRFDQLKEYLNGC